jgi:hypothetical protein
MRGRGADEAGEEPLRGRRLEGQLTRIRREHAVAQAAGDHRRAAELGVRATRVEGEVEIADPGGQRAGAPAFASSHTHGRVTRAQPSRTEAVTRIPVDSERRRSARLEIDREIALHRERVKQDLVEGRKRFIGDDQP